MESDVSIVVLEREEEAAVANVLGTSEGARLCSGGRGRGAGDGGGGGGRSGSGSCLFAGWQAAGHAGKSMFDTRYVVVPPTVFLRATIHHGRGCRCWIVPFERYTLVSLQSGHERKVSLQFGGHRVNFLRFGGHRMDSLRFGGRRVNFLRFGGD